MPNLAEAVDHCKVWVAELRTVVHLLHAHGHLRHTLRGEALDCDLVLVVFARRDRAERPVRQRQAMGFGRWLRTAHTPKKREGREAKGTRAVMWL